MEENKTKRISAEKLEVIRHIIYDDTDSDSEYFLIAGLLYPIENSKIKKSDVGKETKQQIFKELHSILDDENKTITIMADKEKQSARYDAYEKAINDVLFALHEKLDCKSILRGAEQ